MDQIITAVVSLLTLLACGTSPIDIEEPARAPVEERVQLTLGGETVTLGPLRPIDGRPPFCADGQLYETRSEVAVLRVCMPLDGAPPAAHVSFHPGGRLSSIVHWYAGVLEPQNVQLEQSPDGPRRVRLQGRAMLPARFLVASFIGSVDDAALTLSGSAALL